MTNHLIKMKKPHTRLFNQSRSAAGSRRSVCRMRDEGEMIGRFKVRRLIRELGLVRKQPGSHAYKQASVEWSDILNLLNRELNVTTGLVR